MKRQIEKEEELLPEPNVPEQCQCWRMKDEEDEGEFSMLYCWNTLDVNGDVIEVDNFPLRRRSCGFFPVAASHATHDYDRVMINVSMAVKLTCTVFQIQENSDQDCDYSGFCHFVEADALPDRNLDTVRAYLDKTLMCDPAHSSICRIPIDEEHRNKMMVVYPTLLSPDQEQTHAGFSQKFEDCGLTDGFFYRGASGSGQEPLNTYPVVYAGFTEDGDIIGVYAVRVDT